MTDLTHKLRQARELLDQGRFSQARDVLQRIVRHAPADRHVNVLMRHALSRLGEHRQALYYAERAVAAAPNDPEVAALHAMTLADCGEVATATAAMEKALAQHPGHALVVATLARLYGAQDRLGDCLRVCVKAIEGGVRDARVISMYATGLSKIGRADEATPFMRDVAAATAQSTGMADPMQLSSLAGTMLYDPTARPEDLFSAHYAFGRTLMQGAPPPPVTFANTLDPERKLRVALVSGNFRRHPAHWYVWPLLECIDRARFEVSIYSTIDQPDEFTSMHRSRADHWIDASRMSARELTERARADRVDIAIDLAGHFGGNRFAAFHLRMAPVQAAWWSYPCTTGIPAMDYRITDTLADPPGSDPLSTERLIRIDPIAVCWRPPTDDAIDPTPPSERPGADGVTFISLNAAPKLNGQVLSAWARVVKEVRGSKLIVRHRSLASADVRRHIAERLAQAGAPADRVRVEGLLPTAGTAMSVYLDADVALDTWPYPGVTTTCEAMWMGVPVVSMRGHASHSRVAHSIVHAAGLQDLIARDADEFVSMAVSLAGDVERRRALRTGLRSTLQSSALRDETGFARKFENALRQMWRERCEMLASRRGS